MSIIVPIGPITFRLHTSVCEATVAIASHDGGEETLVELAKLAKGYRVDAITGATRRSVAVTLAITQDDRTRTETMRVRTKASETQGSKHVQAADQGGEAAGEG
jgi:DNA gyrase inhibitor GyrI